MDRTLVIPVSAPIPHGHRVEVIERVGDDAEPMVLVVTDLDARIRYQHSVRSIANASTWVGRVLECTITTTGAGISTALTVDPVAPGSSETDVALRGADAAAEAAKDEALRWGGSARAPGVEPTRFW